MADNESGEFSFGKPAPAAPAAAAARNGLTRITTAKKNNGMCHDDSGPPVKAQTIDELHSLQKKRSTPTTPIKGNAVAEEDRQKQQLQSIRYISTCVHMY